MIMKVFKIINCIGMFAATLGVFYFIFAFIAWDVKWIENAHWFFRLLFLITGFPTAISIAISMFEVELIK